MNPNPHTPRPDLLVVGAGLGGLATAWQAQQRGLKPLVLEAGAQVGGQVRSLALPGGWLVEEGPNTVRWSEARVLELIAALDLWPRWLPANPKANRRFVVHGGKPVPLPMGPLGALFSPLVGLQGLRRVLAERRAPWPGFPPETSFEAWVATRFGPQLARRLATPMVQGIWAGDAQHLRASALFPALWQQAQQQQSILRGFSALAAQRKRAGLPKPQVGTFEDGLQELSQRMAKVLGPALKLNTPVGQLRPLSHGWQAITPTGEVFEARHVVLALPASALARLHLPPAVHSILQPAHRLPHASLSIFALGYRAEQVKHPLNGFGLLRGPLETGTALGVLFPGSLFAQRAPQGHVLLQVFVGGTLQPELPLLPTQHLLPLLQHDLHTWLGASGPPVLVHRADWPQAIPQYTTDAVYDEVLAIPDRLRQQAPGLQVLSSLWKGVGVQDRLLQGLLLGDAVADAGADAGP